MKTLADLRLNEDVFGAVLDQAPDAMLLVDDDGFVRFANQAAAGLFGRSTKDLTFMEVEALMPERFRLEHRGHRARYSRAPRRRDMGAGGRLVVLRSDGEEIVTEVCLGPVALPGRRLIVVTLRDVSERVAEEERLRYLSTHDGLTELYNRAFFEAEKARLESGRVAPISVVILDVDDLKGINDRFGHSAGDQHLRRVAAALRGAFRAEDVVARLGGDEFVVLLPGVGPEARDRAIERFLGDLERQNEIAQRRVGVSVGASTAERPEALTAAIRVADERMYQTKRRTRRISERALR